MENITFIPNKSNLSIAFDIGKERLDWYTELPIKNSNGTAVKPLQGACKNIPKNIQNELLYLIELAKKNGYSNVHSLSEPTGIYDRNLLRATKLLNGTSSQVSGEATHNFKAIASRTRNKSDLHDPMVIFRLAQVAPTTEPRDLPFEYEKLKEYGRNHTYAKQQISVLKTRIQELVFRLFPEYPKSKDMLFTNTGRVLITKFGCNPQTITKGSRAVFGKRFKKHAPRCWHSTLDALYAKAKESTGYIEDTRILGVISEELIFHYSEYEFYEKKKKVMEDKMSDCYDQLVLKKEQVALESKSMFSKLKIAQILAETGPIENFSNWKVLMKFAGMNLKENRSGRKIGKTTLDKKGSSRLRRIFMDLAFKLVRKKEIYGTYFHTKMSGGMSGNKAMVAVARKLVKAFYSVSLSGEEIDLKRVALCQSEYIRKAA